MLTFALLSRHYSIRKEFIFTLNYLYNKLGIPLNKKDRKENVINCINSMFDVDLNSNTGINELITVPYVIDRNQYLIVTDYEVDKILSKRRINRFGLFNTYVTIKRYVNRYTGIAYPSIEALMNITHIVSNNTIAKYIEILEELGLLICIRSGNYIVTEEGIRKPNNAYQIV